MRMGNASRRWPAFSLVALLLLGALGVTALSHEAADRLIHPPRDADARTPEHRGLDHERVAVRTADGLTLSGGRIPAEDAQGTIVFLHGHGASKAQSLRVAPFLRRGAYNDPRVRLPRARRLQGAHTTVGLDEAMDVRAAGEDAQLWLVRGADHVNARRHDPGGYERRVLPSLAASFADEQA